LFIAKRITDTHESVWGILIGAVAKVGMPILAAYKLKVAESRCDRIDHMRLFIDRFDGWTRSYTIARVVVA
jgi:hypothetical protein